MKIHAIRGKYNLNLPYNKYSMILPIVAYGNPVLRKMGTDISPDYPELNKLIEDMWETMYNSKGVGLAAPQVNKDIRLFVMDSIQIIESLDDEEKKEYPNDFFAYHFNF